MTSPTTALPLVLAAIFAVSFFRGPDAAAAEEAAPSPYERRVLAGDGGTLPYRILYPVDYAKRRDAGQRFPLVLFLHGAGERGNDNEKHLKFGAGLFADATNRERFPAIVVFPQCPEDGYWVDLEIRRKIRAKIDQSFEEVFQPPTPQLHLVMQLLDKLTAEEAVDADRMYVMGLSMGALGTYELLARRPDQFAAAVPICGGGNTEITERYAGKVAVWITHGDEDEIVPVEYSRRLYKALQQQGAEVKYTEFPGVKHNSWSPTLAMPELLPWLFSHTKAEGETPPAM